MLVNIMIWIGQQSGEILLGLLLTRFLDSLLSDDNRKRIGNFVKLQILVLYLDWVLQKTPFSEPPSE